MKGIIDYEIAKKLNKDYVVIPVFSPLPLSIGAVGDAILTNYNNIASQVKEKTIKYITEIDRKRILRVEEVKEPTYIAASVGSQTSVQRVEHVIAYKIFWGN